MDTINRLVGSNIRRIRIQQGLRLADLVDLISSAGMPMLKTTLSKLENSDRRISVDELVVISEALRVSTSTLLNEPECCGRCQGCPPAGFTCNECRRTG